MNKNINKTKATNKNKVVDLTNFNSIAEGVEYIVEQPNPEQFDQLCRTGQAYINGKAKAVNPTDIDQVIDHWVHNNLQSLKTPDKIEKQIAMLRMISQHDYLTNRRRQGVVEHINEAVPWRHKHMYAELVRDTNLFKDHHAASLLQQGDVRTNNTKHVKTYIENWNKRNTDDTLLVDKLIGQAVQFNRIKIYEILTRHLINQTQNKNNTNAPHPQAMAMTSIIDQGRSEFLEVFLEQYPPSPKNSEFAQGKTNTVPAIIKDNIRISAETNRPEMTIKLINHFDVTDTDVLQFVKDQFEQFGTLTPKQKAKLSTRMV